MSMTARFLALPRKQLDEMLRQPARTVDFLFPDDEAVPPDDRLDIDKSWHAIHYLLTGDVWEGEPPLSRAILGGEPFGEDMGYGPVRHLLPPEVREIADALATVTENDLRQRFGDGRHLTEAEIYPGIWHESRTSLDYVLSHFARLVSFYRRAAASGQAVLLFLV